MSRIVLLIIILSFEAYSIKAFTSSEQGVKETELTANNYMTFAKSLYKNAEILVHIYCPTDGPAGVSSSSANGTQFRIGWLLRQTPCAEEYTGLDKSPGRAPLYYRNPEIIQVKEFNYKKIKTKRYPDLSSNGGQIDQCLVCQPGQTATFLLKNIDSLEPSIIDTKVYDGGHSYAVNSTLDNAAGKADPSASKSGGKPVTGARNKRKAVANAKSTAVTTRALTTTASPSAGKPALITRTWEDGIYLLVLHAYECDYLVGLPDSFRVKARVEIVNRFGYLSAIDWPLLPFFGSMCILYLLFGLLWLGLCAKYWREMLRIQFCISGVIFLGMLEKALFYAEYQSINSTGVSVRGAVMLAELVSCVKRSVARMLVLIVCLGYGIVKPRLGQLQHKVIAIGLVYFVFSAVESSLRTMRPRFAQSRNDFYATIPLALTDAIICWWIFSSLVQTIRNLRVRRNLVKLSLYRHFTNTLVFCVVCSVVFMAWSVGRHKFAICITAWRELWIDDAFWHLLFSVILFVIIILWRPSQNNQRYAFTPLLDAGNDSDEDEEVIMDNLAEGVKARGSAAAAQQQQQQQQQRSRQSSRGEDNLRWVEENIPQSLVESTLPSLLHDSDEEVLTTKYEMSKLL